MLLYDVMVRDYEMCARYNEGEAILHRVNSAPMAINQAVELVELMKRENGRWGEGCDVFVVAMPPRRLRDNGRVWA